MMEISAPQIQKIKVMQRKLGLDDDAYREMLWGVAKVKSCKELKGPKIQLVMKHMEKCLGIEGKTSQPRPQVREIRRLWGRVSRVAQEWGPESRQAHQALKTFLWGRFKVAAPEWLTLPQAQRVIEALKAMGRREEKQVPGVRGQENSRED
jgi:phage gp16-like protein